MTPAGSAGPHFWEGTGLGWHVAFAMIAVVVVASLTVAEISDTRRWLCALMAGWYVWMGAPNLVNSVTIMASPPSGSGSPGRSTTGSRRGSPAS